MKSTRLSYMKFAFSIFLLLTVVYLSFQSRELLIHTVKQTKPIWALIGLLCYFLNYMARAHRIRNLCPSPLKIFPTALKISSLHGFLSYVLPMRAGDFSLSFLLLSISSVPITQGNAIFIRTRLADFFALGVLLVVSIIAPNSIQNNYLQTIFLGIGIAMCLLPFLGMRLLNHRGAKKLWIFQKIFGEERFKHISPIEGLLSINIWFWTGCTSFCVIKTFGLQLSLFDAWFLAAVQLPLQLLPIQGLANAGTHEAGWVFGLNLLGVSPDLILSVAIATHALLFVYILVLGAFALFLPSSINADHVA